MKKILIIEDDLVIARIYRSKYEAAGYDVTVVGDGKQGLHLIKETKPALVQLDLTLPKLDGVEIIKQIRASPGFESLPIIVLSNSYRSDLVKAAWQAGATKCLSKLNCTPKLMLDYISEALMGSPPPAGPAPAPGSSPAVAPAAAPAPVSVSPQAQLDSARDEVRHEFRKRSAEMLANLRKQARDLSKAADTQSRTDHLQELYRTARFLTAYAGITGFLQIGQLAGALESLLQELQTQPGEIAPSNLRTITNAVDALAALLEGGSAAREESLTAALILVVDDEPISRHALATALRKVQLRCLRIGNPRLALDLLAENQFDLIFLDVAMPEMDGFEFCKQVRTLAANKTTPVVFVTGRADFASRAQSILSGGTDLIAKPFLLMELAVKALTCLSNARLPGKTAEASASPPA